MAEAIRLHLRRPIPLPGLRKQAVFTDMYYSSTRTLVIAYMRLTDGGRIVIFNSSILGSRQGLSRPHPGMSGKKGDQCDQKELFL